MKVISVECYLGDKGLGGSVTVKINTNENISNFGETGLAYGKCSEAVFDQCQGFAKMVLGMSSFSTKEIWEHLHRRTFWSMGDSIIVTSAIATIDTACWDTKGKTLNVPIYKPTGGKTNKELQIYANQLQFRWHTLIEKSDALTLLYDPKDCYDVVKDAMAEGYDTVKIDPVFVPLEEWPMAEVMAIQGNQIRDCCREHDLTRSVGRIVTAREAGSPDPNVVMEVHSLLGANAAALLGQALEPYRIMYYKELTISCNPGVFEHIKEQCRLPLTIRERSYTCWSLCQFFGDRTLDIIQPDLCSTRDVAETEKICNIAQVYDTGVQIHICSDPTATAAALRVEVAIPNFAIHEGHNVSLLRIFKGSGKYYHIPVSGLYEIPELPDIGQEVSEQATAATRKVVIE